MIQGVYGDILVGGDRRTSVLEADASPFLSPKNESHWKVAWNLWSVDHMMYGSASYVS